MEPMYGMSEAQEQRFFRLSDQLRLLGYWVSSEPYEGQIDLWLYGVECNLLNIQNRLSDIQKAYRLRGRSKAALYYLTSNDRFDPGFGISMTQEQRDANKAYAAKLKRGVDRWNAAFGKSAA